MSTLALEKHELLLTVKMKQEFFKTITVSVLLYGLHHISYSESDATIHIAKAQIDTDWSTTIWKSNLSDKINSGRVSTTI